MLVLVSFSLNLLFVLLVAWASLRHFRRSEREPLGARLLTLATAAGTAFNGWLALRHPRPSDLEAAIALLLTLAAFAVFVAAVKASRDGGFALAFSDATPGAVVDHGIYAVMRHPFYASYILYWLSWLPLSSLDPLSCLVAGGMIAAYSVAAHREERLLLQRLGERYAALMGRSWRFMPGVY